MKTSQNNLILEYMKKHGSISTREACNKLGVYRLSARIKDLKDKGIKIKTENHVTKNTFGETVRYAVYKLVETKEEN